MEKPKRAAAGNSEEKNISLSEKVRAYIKKEKERPQSVTEEVFNGITHGVASLAAIAGTVILAVLSVKNDRPASIVTGLTIYGITMILLYLMSTLYHCLSFTRAKEVLKVFDHCAIFFLIAGTYTPMAIKIGGACGWTIFGIVWGLTLVGTILEAVFKSGVKKISMFIYLAMGWLIVIAWNPLLDSVDYRLVFWLLTGGLAYTGGVVFYIMPGRYFFHVLWHFAVIAGSVFHFIGIMFYIA